MPYLFAIVGIAGAYMPLAKVVMKVVKDKIAVIAALRL
jgi:hypothetical protein